jgi:hypothetical protein
MMKKAKQLAAALMAFDPLLARQAIAKDGIDLRRVKKPMQGVSRHECNPFVQPGRLAP